MNAAESGQVNIGSFTVNRLGFGAMRITGDGVWGMPPDVEKAKAVLRRAVELGVNFIDTADAYGPEVSEQLIHDALYPYDGLVIATKGGLTRPAQSQWVPDGSPEHLQSAVEGSLERLGVTCLDVYQLHAVDPAVSLSVSLGALVELREAGKIKHIGLSNVSLEQLQAAVKQTEIVSVQNRYNVASSSDSEAVLQFCAQNKLAFIPYFPVGGDGSDFSALSSIAQKHGVSTHQIALAWLLAHSPATLPIPGTSSISHLEDNIAAGTVQLDQDDLETLNHV